MNGKIKIYSRAALLGRYLKTVPVILAGGVLWLIFNNLFFIGEPLFLLSDIKFPVFAKILFSVLTAVISFMVLSPFCFGRNIWMFENAKRNEMRAGKIFSFYRPKLSLRIIKLYAVILLPKVLFTILFLLPWGVLTSYLIYSVKTGMNGELFVALCIFSAVLFLVGIFFSFVVYQRYFLSEYIFLENMFSPVKESVKLSKVLTEKECFKIALFKMSFFPWILSCIFILPVFYVYPYYKTAVSLKAAELLTKNKNSIDYLEK